MSVKFSEWIDGTVHCPQVAGWYEVRHPKEGWISGTAHARWDGTQWKRAMGWPSLGNEGAFEIYDGRLVVAQDIRLWGEVKPTQWRGFL